MDSKAIRYWVEVAGNRYPVRTARGEEASSKWSHFEVTFLASPSAPLDPDDLVGADATLVLEREHAERSIQLVVAEAERYATLEDAELQRAGAEVVLRLESRFARLRHRVDIRVFRNRDVPTIVEKVTGFHRVEVERRLASSYRVRPYTVQFRESDFAFVSRLLEDEGIGYVLNDSGSLVLFDSSAAYESGGPIPFKSATQLSATDDAIFEVGHTSRIGPSSIGLRDFDFERPASPVTSVSPVAGPAATGGAFSAYPAKRTTPSGASSKATTLSEGFQTTRYRLSGKSFAPRLRPGLSVDIQGSPGGFADGAHAIARVVHDFDVAEGGFAIAFEAVPAGQTLRPEPITPWPRISGPLQGFVVGASGEDIHTDSWGRAKIHFPWDRIQPKTDDASDWIPALQDNTGHSIGIPRVGWEMLVHFADANPDNPVIVGRIYNPLDPFYAVLPGNRTHTALRSLTSPRSKEGEDASENRVTLEDSDGRQLIEMRAQRDRTIHTAHDRTEHTVHNERRDVERDETIDVGRNRTVHIQNNKLTTVIADQTVHIGGNMNLKVSAGQNESIRGDHSLDIGGSHTRRIEATDTVSVSECLSERVGALLVEASVEGNNTNAEEVGLRIVGGAQIDVAKLAVSHASQKDRDTLVGALWMTKATESISKGSQDARTTTIGGNQVVKAGTIATLSGDKKLTIKALEGIIAGSKKVCLKVGETEITFEKGLISFKAKDAITIRAEARGHIKTGQSKQNP